MKTVKCSVILGFILLLITTISCSKDGDVIFIPDLSQQWRNNNDATNTFFFLVTTPNQSNSSFTGNENPSGGGAQDNFTGSFTNNKIEFTYTNGSKTGQKYSGTINQASTQMNLTSTTLGNLVLIKN